MIKLKTNSLTEYINDFFNWLLYKSYLSTPGIYFVVSLFLIFLFIDSDSFLFLLLSLLLCIFSIFIYKNLKGSFALIFVWILFLLLSHIFFIGPVKVGDIQNTNICGVIQNIDQNDIKIVNADIDGRVFTRELVLRNVENDLLYVRSFQSICIVSNSEIKRSTGFSYAINYTTDMDYIVQNNDISDLIFHLRTELNTTMSDFFAEESGVLSAMLFGVKDGIEPDDKKLFYDLGLGHVLVASGANIITILLIIKFFFEKLIQPKFGKNYFCFISYFLVVTTYLLVVGMEGSLTRAVIFWLFVNLEVFIGRKINPLGKVTLITLLMSIIFPFLIFSYSYILSIVAVAGLMIASDISDLKNLSENSISEQFISSLIVVSLTGFISGYFFKSINMTGVIANILFLPIIQIIVMSGFTISVLIFISEFLGLWFLFDFLHLLAQFPIIILQILYELMNLFRNFINKSLIFKTFIFNSANLFIVFSLIFMMWVVLWYLVYNKKKNDFIM